MVGCSCLSSDEDVDVLDVGVAGSLVNCLSIRMGRGLNSVTLVVGGLGPFEEYGFCGERTLET